MHFLAFQGAHSWAFRLKCGYQSFCWERPLLILWLCLLMLSPAVTALHPHNLFLHTHSRTLFFFHRVWCSHKFNLPCVFFVTSRCCGLTKTSIWTISNTFSYISTFTASQINFSKYHSNYLVNKLTTEYHTPTIILNDHLQASPLSTSNSISPPQLLTSISLLLNFQQVYLLLNFQHLQLGFWPFSVSAIFLFCAPLFSFFFPHIVS